MPRVVHRETVLYRSTACETERGLGVTNAPEANALKRIHRVAIIGVFPPPAGGQAIYNVSLLNELNRRGWRAEGIDCSSSASADDAVLSAPTRKDLVRVMCDHPFGLFHLTASDTRFLGFEVIVGVLSILKRVPFIVTILAGRFGNRAARYTVAHRYVLGAVLRRAACILISNADQEQAVRLLPFLSRARIDTVGCSVPMSKTVEHDPTLLAFLNGGNPGIMAVGAIRKIYGFPLLVEACAHLREQGLNPRLLVAVSGKDDPETASAFQDSIRAAKQSVEVRVERELPHAVCLGCIESADIFARPTLADGDSVSVHEALQLGTTVVASNATPRPAGVFLYETGDARALAASLQEAYRCHAGLGNRGGEETSVDSIVRCYESVLYGR
jgi:glycogen(starch) synthase